MKTGHLDNFYNRLGISFNASQDEIKHAYYQAAKKLHPDQNKNKKTIDLFLLIQEAYETLSSPEKRIEYNKFLPKDFVPTQDILINTFYSKSSILNSSKPQLVYAMIHLMANIDNETTSSVLHIPTNISLVIDISTSMIGQRINEVKSIAMELTNLLHSSDRIAITAFNDRALCIFPLSKIPEPTYLANKLNNISPSGGTEIFQGLSVGYDELSLHLSQNHSNQLIIITDGHTYGDEEKCLNLAEKAAQHNVMIHCVGIGHEWNDDFLNKLANITGGSCSYAPQVNEIRDIIFYKIQAIQKIYAKNIQMKLQIPKNVDVRYAFQLDPEAQEIQIVNNLISTANLSIENEVSLLFEILITDTSNVNENEDFNFFNGILDFSVPSSINPLKTIPIDLFLPCKSTQNIEAPSEAIISALRKLSLFRMEAQARRHLEKGEIERARLKFNNLATQMLDAGNDDLAKTIMLQTQMLSQSEDISEVMKKNIKYGTQTLISNEFSEKR